MFRSLSHPKHHMPFHWCWLISDTPWHLLLLRRWCPSRTKLNLKDLDEHTSEMVHPLCVLQLMKIFSGLYHFLTSSCCHAQVRFFSWLEAKLAEGYEITEWEAAHRLTEFRRKNPLFMGLAYENISASGPNAALPHYSTTKSKARMIDRNTPYLKWVNPIDLSTWLLNSCIFCQWFRRTIQRRDMWYHSNSTFRTAYAWAMWSLYPSPSRPCTLQEMIRWTQADSSFYRLLSTPLFSLKGFLARAWMY